MNRLAELNVEAVEVEDDDSVLSDVIQDFAPIKNGIKKIRSNVDTLRKIIAEEKRNIDPARAKQNEAKMNTLMQDTQRTSATIKASLKERKEDNDEFRETAGPALRTQVEMRTNVYNSSTREFYDVMNEYTNCVKKAQKNMQDQLKRRLQIVSEGELSEDKMEELLEDPQKAQEVISGAIQGENIKSLVNEVNQRNEQMRALERQVRVVYELFRDLDVLVDIQGERLEMISNHVSSAHDHVIRGNEHLEQAVVHKRSANRCKCILAIVLVLALLTVVLYVVLSSN